MYVFVCLFLGVAAAVVSAEASRLLTESDFSLTFMLDLHYRVLVTQFCFFSLSGGKDGIYDMTA